MMVLVRATAGDEQGIGWSGRGLHAHVGAAISNLRHIEYFHDHQRIEQMLFDGLSTPMAGY
jgi:hypothetical protein